MTESSNVYGQMTTVLSPHTYTRSIGKDGGSVFDNNKSMIED